MTGRRRQGLSAYERDKRADTLLRDIDRLEGSARDTKEFNRGYRRAKETILAEIAAEHDKSIRDDLKSEDWEWIVDQLKAEGVTIGDVRRGVREKDVLRALGFSESWHRVCKSRQKIATPPSVTERPRMKR